MAATGARLPTWQPVSMLDIGSGPGTALWAALEQWPSLSKLTAWEREPAFIDLGRRLAYASGSQALRDATWRKVTLGGRLPDLVETYDLIVFGHVLNELPESLREEAVRWAWQHCSGVLLIVEPGTSTAFPIVKALREHLLRLDAHTLAPCTHDKPCPLVNDWCHFPQRLERPAFQRRAKAAPAGWEESKFSYAAMSRFPSTTPAWGRLIHQPDKQKQQVNLTISSTDGVARHAIPKRDREAFRSANKHDWGDLLDTPLE
jgi:ribosomal protein RSM22 (predicted rRNA methylase)